MTTAGALVRKLWNFATVLRDDGLSYGDYVEQLTYLLFLSPDPRVPSKGPINQWVRVPPEQAARGAR